MIIFNLVGLLILAAGGALGFGIGYLAGTTDEGPLMIFGSPFIIAGDLLYRLFIKRKDGHWIAPRGGGHLFFIPVWLFGVLWLILGVVYTVRGP